jgi:hypothetical protein
VSAVGALLRPLQLRHKFLPLAGGICYGLSGVRKFGFILILAITVLLSGNAWADNFTLANGETVSGEPLWTSANDQGLQIKTTEGKYERIPWVNFSQEDLKKFKETPKLAPLVEPYIEVTQEERIKKTEVVVKQPPRIELPARKSFFAAMFSSGPGLVLLLLLYAATIYAGYEVAIFRAQPIPLVAGLSAVPFFGFLAPIVFLSMPTRMTKAADLPEAPGEAAPAAHTEHAGDTVNPMQGETAPHPGGLKLHHEPEPAKPEHPPATVFQRGQFTFNKRFIETKFTNFFSPVRREGDKDMVLIFKTARGEYQAQRISRIAANDLHLEVHRGGASEEVLVPFTEIKEIIIKHKDAP